MRRKKPPLLNDKNLLKWVGDFGRVTAANVALRFDVNVKVAAKALMAADANGTLIRTGGGPGDSFYWHLSEKA